MRAVCPLCTVMHVAVGVVAWRAVADARRRRVQLSAAAIARAAAGELSLATTVRLALNVGVV